MSITHCRVLYRVALCLLCLATIIGRPAVASVLVSQTFTTTAATGWTLGGGACLTAVASGGSRCSMTPYGETSGWLRLTDINTSGNEEGYAYYTTSFASAQGFVVDFDYASWGGTGADGLLMFLADSSKTFSVGDAGGSFSYANGCSVNGMNGGWVGIALDEFGNFSNPGDRCKNGGPGAVPASVALRGSGTGGTTGYTYIAGSQASTALDCPATNPGLSGPTPDTCSSRPATTSVDFRHCRITIIYSGGTWQAYVDVQFGAGASYTRVLSSTTISTTAPTNLRIGFAASTGGSTNYHEIRNLTVTNPVDTSVVKTVSQTSAAPGDIFTYTLAVADSNLTAATSTVVTDTLPSYMVPSTTSPLSYSVTGSLLTSNSGGTTTCTYSSPTITCTVGTLPASGAGNIVLTMKGTTGASNTGTSVTNTAVISQADLDINQNNNTSTVTSTMYSSPSMTAAKSANSCTSGCKVNPNGTLLYTIQVTNSGGPSASNVLTDTMSLHTALQINYGGTGNPFTFSAGSTGLTMGTPVYSKDNGATWTYTLASGAGGAPTNYDGLVTNIKIPMTGTMTGGGTTYSVTYNTNVFK